MKTVNPMKNIKDISIREYLTNIGIHPVKEYGYYGMYHCPYGKTGTQVSKSIITKIYGTTSEQMKAVPLLIW